MMDFVLGWVLGRNSKKRYITHNTISTVKPEIDIPKDYSYSPIEEIEGMDSTLEENYRDYERAHCVVIVKNGVVKYYIEQYIPITTPDFQKYI